MAANISPDLIARYGGNLPRYTSYPTAVSFSDAIGPQEVADWLKALPPEQSVSLYFHVPFCDELCRFCACNTAVMRQEEARAAYGDTLLEEMHRIVALVGQGRVVRHLHFGGGTPTTLPETALRNVMSAVREQFRLADDAEIAMEMDPRHVPEGMLPLLAELGFNRISFGVQDLDRIVQETCGRVQSYEQTLACVEQARAAGVNGVNIDLIYGLPYQTVESVQDTARRVAGMRPDRLAVFGYAHVPWKQKRQQLIPQDSLPSSEERLQQADRIDRVLVEEGYKPIGLDHYAHPEDAMAHAYEAGTLHRNFQGYTIDSSPVLLGMGASAISMTPDGFYQNIPSTAAYIRALKEHDGLPVARGVFRTEEDRWRGKVIETVMCLSGVDLTPYIPSGQGLEQAFAEELEALRPFEEDGLIRWEGNRVSLTEKGGPFLRHLAAVFDTRRKELAAAGEGKPVPRFSSSL
ncbi:oxygen-independent coproporphyrinogen III oxidase [Parasaccharibacter sp. TMW 2.1886]|nr:oxygen-independent coproporphyrinogen III oxidase [Parasaccharibacter sp. TMW 2.1886]